MKEEFKDIPDFIGLYEISNFGYVKSMDRLIPFKNTFKHILEKELKPGLRSGYEFVTLSKNGIKTPMSIHILVAICFLGHIPNGRISIIDHKDENKLNNRLDNLQITTVRKNTNKSLTFKNNKRAGVTWNKKCKKWRTRISIKGKSIHLGMFNTKLEASNAYKNKLKTIKA